MEVLTFKVDVRIPVQMVQDLLVCAFEGGSNYWYDQLEPLKQTLKGGHASDRFYGNMLKHGFRLVDKESDNKVHEIKPHEFLTALQVMYNKHHGHFNDIVSENTDAATGDVFLQCLVFGDVIYG
jgi:hypothetical protein